MARKGEHEPTKKDESELATEDEHEPPKDNENKHVN